MSCSGRSTSACSGSSGPVDISSEENSLITDLPKGLGPRIYVGGIPSALSQTMIRNHFGQYGKVVDVYFPKHPVTNQRQAFCFVTFSTRKAANVAVSQSNRKINGQLVSSIAATADRPMHHRVGQHAAPTSAPLQAVHLQSRLCNAYARAAVGPDHLPPAALQHALAGWPGQASPAHASGPFALDAASISGLYSLLQQQGLIQSNPALAVLLAANGMAQGNWHGGGALPVSRPTDAGQAAALASTIAASCHPYTRVEDAVMACHATTASDLVPLFTSRDTVPNYLNAASVMATMADWPCQPAVPPPQPDVPFNLHTEYGFADSLDSFLASGPQRHNHVTDMRSARHSPY
ncbi:hypothetical protein ABBQ38_004047 [Trebouxia sp. C0009 RCD-2024]